MPPPNGAGDLPLDEELTGLLTIRTGNIQENPRRGDKREIAVKVSDGFQVLRARVDTVARPLGVPEDFVIFFRKTKTAVQANFKEMNAENFEEWLRARWAKITRNEVDKWREEAEKTPKQMPVFEFYVYKPKPVQQSANRMQRATQGRIAAARERLQQHDNQNNIQRGAIEMGHLAVVNARRGNGEEIAVADDNTTRQARQLDQEREQLRNEDEQSAAARNAELKPISIQLNGTMVEVQVNVRSLRDALGLPQYNMFHEGIYRGYNHEQVEADEDEEDTEHANPQVGAVGVE